MLVVGTHNGRTPRTHAHLMLRWRTALTALRCGSSAPCPSVLGRALFAPPPLVRRAHLSSPAPSPPSPPPPPPPPPSFADQNDTWVDRRAPPWLHPYLKLTRIDRPVGTYLVLLPGLWGLAIAAPAGGLPAGGLVALFSAGAFLMRGAGCTVNDIWDRGYDGRVARTAARPLASGRLGLPAALAFLGAQLGAGLAVLLQLEPCAVALGCAVVPIVLAYPLAKRVTHWPQAVLGVAMNYGIVMGWGATHGCASGALTAAAPVVAPLFAGAICWTIVYDTLYAHQDAADDARLGLRSTALLMGSASREILSGFALAAGAGWAVAGAAAGIAGAPYAAVVASSTTVMLWQVRTADYADRASLARRFASSHWVGWIMLAGIIAGKVAQAGGEGEGEGEGGEGRVARVLGGSGGTNDEGSPPLLKPPPSNRGEAKK